MSPEYFLYLDDVCVEYVCWRGSPANTQVIPVLVSIFHNHSRQNLGTHQNTNNQKSNLTFQ